MPKTKRILVITDSRTPGGFQYVAGIQDYFAIDHWELHVEDTGNLQMIPRINVALRDWKPHGIVANIVSRTMERIVKESGLPAVHVGPRTTALPTVRTDEVGVGRMVARHFLDNGFQKFAFFSRFATVWSQERCQGFAQTIADAGFSCTISTHRYIGLNETNWLHNRQKIDQWLKSLDKPVAIMCVHDTRASQVAWACRRLGLSVPDDVAIVGVENQRLICRSCFPPLSSVELGATRVGYQAAWLLERMLRGHKPPKKPISVPPLKIIVRQSSDKVAVDDPYVTEAVALIRSPAGQGMSVKEIMRSILISRRSLEKRFKKMLGHTPREEILRVRINKAKTLLEDTDWAIPRVAQDAGFTGPEVFTAAFHRETGMTPRDYRRKTHGGELKVSA